MVRQLSPGHRHPKGLPAVVGCFQTRELTKCKALHPHVSNTWGDSDISCPRLPATITTLLQILHNQCMPETNWIRCGWWVCCWKKFNWFAAFSVKVKNKKNLVKNILLGSGQSSLALTTGPFKMPVRSPLNDLLGHVYLRPSSQHKWHKTCHLFSHYAGPHVQVVWLRIYS